MLKADLAVLAEPDRGYVEHPLALSPALAKVRDLAQRFGAIVRTRSMDALTPWLADADRGTYRASPPACFRTSRPCVQP